MERELIATYKSSQKSGLLGIIGSSTQILGLLCRRSRFVLGVGPEVSFSILALGFGKSVVVSKLCANLG